jgi:hypothetical protein
MANESNTLYFGPHVTVANTVKEILQHHNYKSAFTSSHEILEGTERDYILATGDGLWLEADRTLASYISNSSLHTKSNVDRAPEPSPLIDSSDRTSLSAPASLSSSPQDSFHAPPSSTASVACVEFSSLLSNLTQGSLQLIRPGTFSADEKMRKQIEDAMRQFETQQMPTFLPGESQLWKRENVTCSAPPLPRVKGQLYITNYQLIFFCYERSTYVCGTTPVVCTVSLDFDTCFCTTTVQLKASRLLYSADGHLETLAIRH